MSRPYKCLCPTCNTLLSGQVGEDLIVVCQHCVTDDLLVRTVYEEILRARPQHRDKSPGEVFALLWASWQQDHPGGK